MAGVFNIHNILHTLVGTKIINDMEIGLVINLAMNLNLSLFYLTETIKLEDYIIPFPMEKLKD